MTLKPCLPALPALSSCEPFLHLTKQPQNHKKHARNLQNPVGVFALRGGRLRAVKQAILLLTLLQS